MKKVILPLTVICSLGYTGGVIPPITKNVEKVNIEEKNLYLGMGISAMSSRDSSVSMDIFNVTSGQDRLGNISFHAGYEFSENLVVEGRYQTEIMDEHKVNLDSGWSLFVKPMYRFDDEENQADGENYTTIYALLGYGGVSISGVNGVSVDIDESGFQWGLGVSYTFREESNDEMYRYVDTWSIFADYTNLGNDMTGPYYNGAPEVDFDAFTVGVTYKF